MKTQHSRFLSIRSLLTAAFVCAASLASAQSFNFNKIWEISPGSRPYVTTGLTERGIAISPLNKNVFIVSRAAAVGGLGIYVLDGDTGAELLNATNGPLTLSTNGITGGTLILNAIGVADDGVIYACNLSGTGFKVYRWADVNSDPTIAFGGASGASPGAATRYGDTMDVRGSGAGTQIIVAGSGSGATGFAVLTTTDGLTFTSTGIPNPVGTSAGEFGKGIAFGTGDTVYGKKEAVTTVRNASFDLVGGTSTFVGDITVDSTMAPIALDVTNHFLAGVLVGAANDTANHKLKIYDISTPTSPSLRYTTNFPSSANTDSSVGAVDFGADRFVAVDSGDGVVCVTVTFSVAAVAPVITLQPQSQTVLSGGFVTFSSDASGSTPMKFQWYSNNIPILGTNGTNKVLFMKPVYAGSAGNYFMTASNVAGVATSDTAVLTIDNSSQASGFAEEVWSLGGGTRPYLPNSTLVRGMCYNPGTDSILVASGAAIGATPVIYVLNAATGADRRTMNMTGVSGGYFPLLAVAAAEDGVVYAMNMTLRGEAMKLYRWSDDSASTVPTVAYGPDNVWGAGVIDDLNRLGDTINVRGQGTNTQIICAVNGYNKAVIFTTTDGLNFTPTPINVTNSPADNYQFRLGVAFGSGDTFWAKGLRDDAHGRAENAYLRNVAFNLASGTGEIVHTYSAARDTMSAIGVEVQNDILAGLNFGTPDSIKVFDISDLSAEPPVMDQDFYATDNANTFLTGAFDSGGGRLYSLNTGNGLLCLRINTTIPTITKQPVSLTNAAGTRAVFSVKSTGYPRTSRWQFNGTDIPSANTSTLTIHEVHGTNAGNYRLIITNTLGAVTSSIVNLRVTAGILTNPVSQIVSSGDPMTLTVAADGELPLTYQWKLNGTNVLGATNTSLTFASIDPTNGGSYTVAVTGPLNTTTSTAAFINVLQSSTQGDGTGLTAQYWSDDTNKTFTGSPTLTRLEPYFPMDWGAGSPDPLISSDHFTARFSGQVQPLYSQTYTFYATTDDGVRVTVNGQKIIDRWTAGLGTSSGNITLAANQKYNFIMEYFDDLGNASVDLQWSSVSQLQATIPPYQLYPTLGTNAPVTPVPITATRNGNSLVFTWSGSFNLQSATNVTGPYTTVAGAVSPYTNSVTAGPQKFFRLRDTP